MIMSCTYRGDLTNEDQLVATQDLTGDEWIGEIVKVPHPASGHMGGSMGEVVETKTTTGKRPKKPLWERKKEDNGSTDSETEYEEYEYTILVIEDLLIDVTYHTHQSGNPEASFVADGETYSIFGIEQQKEDGEWVQIPFRNGNRWSHNQFGVEDERKAIDPTNTIVIKRSVTFHRDDDADLADPTGYTLTEDTQPIDVKPP